MLTMHSSILAKDYNIISYGAVADGKTLNTAAVQSAIDQAFKDGGGRVIVPSGRFMTGSIVLKSGVELHLLKGARLMGSTKISDYYAISINKWKALLMADDAHNISITGKGTIDGQGSALALHVDSLFYAGKLDSSLYQMKEKRPVPHARPQIIQFVKCNNIRVTGVTIRNSASWVQTYDLCNNILIDRIRVESVSYWNNDGMDIIDSKNVTITNCYVNSADDGICIKSYQRNGGIIVFCDSIYIANCVVRSSACAIKLGTSSFGGFKNVTIEKIKVFDTYRSAIALECWETGILENILVQDIKAVNTGNAIFIRLSKRRNFKDYPMGKLRNVTVKNVKVTVPYEQPDYDYELRGPTLPFFHNVFPASITGIPGYSVENLTLENIKIIYPGRGNKSYANLPISRLADIPEKIEDYPEFSMFGELPAWAFYVRHVDGLSMKNVKVKIRKPDYRPAFVFDDVKNLSLEAIRVVGDKKSDQKIFNQVEMKK
jgi:Glycosyl hydrolases family 28